MNQPQAYPIEALDFRADSYSPDGRNIIVSFATKYSAERRTYSLPVASLQDFIADLQKLQRPSGPTTASHTPTTPSPSNTQMTPAQTAGPEAKKDPNRIDIRVPKRWMLRTGPPERPLVIMVFDPQTEIQAGFALTEKAAREMAAGLVKQADSLAKREAGKPGQNGGQQSSPA